MGVTVSEPWYSGHPGTVDLGGARPPPQSRSEQISSVSGTYQMTVSWALPPVGFATILATETQPLRSVLAATWTRDNKRAVSTAEARPNIGDMVKMAPVTQ